MKKFFLWIGLSLILIFLLSLAVSFFAFPQPSVNIPVQEQPEALEDGKLYPLVLRSPQGTDTTLQVELADSKAERTYGLMNRVVVKNGMLFVFPESTPVAFWMKNTLAPLDIAYFDANGKYVSSVAMDPCRIDPCPLYPSAAPALYALEMPRGFFDQYPVAKDWSIIWQH